MERDMQAVSSRESSPAVKNNRDKSSLIAFALVSLVVIATVLAYSPVLFNFFLGDDFVHLTWLREAVKHPELIWKNFHSSWLDGTTTRFYRPLISVFMVTDYLGWRIDGLGFHITNVLFHLTATVFLFFTARIFLQDARADFVDSADYNGVETTVDADGMPVEETSATPANNSTGSVNRTGAPSRTGTFTNESASSTSKLIWLYPLTASLIFGLYPLHTEAVSWITGRVDAVVTAFYVAAFYFYLRWRKGGNVRWLTATMVSFALGLLSKEMALTLPPAFMLYEALLGPNALLKDPQAKLNSKYLIKWAIDVVKPSFIFWLMVVVYFAVRRYALGTFVGGYDDSLFFIADMKHFVLSWLHGLRMFLIPLNKGLMDAHNFITRAWTITLIVTSVLVALNVFLEKKLLRLFIFNGIFLAFCFAPVYKIFTISDDLQGARLAHVATVALSLLLAMAFIVPQRKKFFVAANAKSGSTIKNSEDDTSKNLPTSNRFLSKLSSPTLRILIGTCFSTLCFAGLWTNNQAWSKAGHEANAIRVALHQLYDKIEGDPQVLLVGLPDNYNGAYICRNAIDGMTKMPQLQRDIRNCLSINGYEQILPFAFLKESLFDARDNVHVFFWDTTHQVFKPLPLEKALQGKTLWSKGDLKELASVKAGVSEWSPDGSLIVKGDNSNKGRPEVILNFGKRSSFDMDFLVATVRNLDTTGGSTPNLATEGVDALFTNDIRPEFELINRTHAAIKPEPETQTLVFPLQTLPEWCLGGNSHEIMLKFPRNSNIAIDSIELVHPDRLVPRITFENSGFMGTKGYMHMSQKDNQNTIFVDASRIPNATGVVLEITRTNLLFETQNTTSESNVAMTDVKPTGTVSGDIKLTRNLFKGAGLYEIRPWAVDKTGKKLGVAGNHIVVNIAD